MPVHVWHGRFTTCHAGPLLWFTMRISYAMPCRAMPWLAGLAALASRAMPCHAMAFLSHCLLCFSKNQMQPTPDMFRVLCSRTWSHASSWPSASGCPLRWGALPDRPSPCHSAQHAISIHLAVRLQQSCIMLRGNASACTAVFAGGAVGGGAGGGSRSAGQGGGSGAGRQPRWVTGTVGWQHGAWDMHAFRMVRNACTECSFGKLS